MFFVCTCLWASRKVYKEISQIIRFLTIRVYIWTEVGMGIEDLEDRSEATNLQKIPRSPWTFQSYWYKPTTLIPSQTLNSDVSLTDFSQIGPTTKWKLNSATAFDLMKLFYLLWVRRMYHRETVAPTWSFYLWDWEGM